MSLDITSPPEPKKTGYRWIDLLVAILALTISTVSILVARQTSETMERLAHASFWPFVQHGSGNVNDAGEQVLSFGIENVGTGPARIHRFELEVDGQSVPLGGHMLTNLLRTCCNAEFDAAVAQNNGDVFAVYGGEISSPVSSRFVAPNADVTAIRWPRTTENAALWTALDQARQQGRITMSTCYCSVFDECWVAHSDAFPPEEADSCTAPDQSGAAP